MAYCINCGREAESGAQFCMHCGTRILPDGASESSTIGRASKVLKPPEEVEIPKGSSKGGQIEASIWIMRIGFVAIMLILLSNPSAILSSPFNLVSTVAILILLVVGPEFILQDQRKRLVRLRVNEKGISSDEYRSFFGMKRSSIQIDAAKINKIEAIYVSPSTYRIDTTGANDAYANTLVVYLQDGSVHSFSQRDPAAIRTACGILRNVVNEPTEETKGPEPEAVNLNIKIQNKIDRRFFYLVLVMFLGFVGYSLFFALDLTFRPEPKLVGAGIFYVVAIVFSVVLFPIYRINSVKAAEMRMDGILLTTFLGEKLVPWEKIKEIKLGSAAGVSNIKNRMAAICLSERRFYSVSYDIGLEATKAYEKTTGRTSPVDVIGVPSRSERSKIQELDIIQQERPDLIRRKHLVTNGTLGALVLSLVGLVLGLIVILILGLVVVLLLRFLGKRTDDEIKRYMEWKWSSQTQQGLEMK